MTRRSTRTLVILGVAAIAATAVASLGGCGGGARSSSTEAGPHHGSAGEPGLERPPADLASIPRCAPADLVVWRNGRDGNPVGPTYYTSFIVTNLGPRACTLSGHPRLSALTVEGRLLERSIPGSVPGENSRRTVKVAARGNAMFRASWGASGFVDPVRCRPRYAARYRVVLPGAARASVVPFPFPGRCTAGRPGVGITVGGFEAYGPPADLPPLPAPHLTPPRRGEHLPRCAPSKLVVALDAYAPAGSAALTSYMRIAVTNLSDRTCIASGVPTVVAVDTAGHPIGPPAEESPSGIGVAGDTRHVGGERIEPDGVAYFLLAAAYPSGYGPHECGYKVAAGLRITLPGSSASQFLPMPIRRCPRRMGAGEQLSVGRIE